MEDNVSELTARTNHEGWATIFVEWLKISKLQPKGALIHFLGRPRPTAGILHLVFGGRDLPTAGIRCLADAPGLAKPARQGADLHLHGGAAGSGARVPELDVRRELLRRHDLRPPLVSIEALNELATALAAGGKLVKRGSRSRPSEPRRRYRAEREGENEPGRKTTGARSRTAGPGSPSPTIPNTRGVVEALADLPLEALEALGAQTVNRRPKLLAKGPTQLWPVHKAADLGGVPTASWQSSLSASWPGYWRS